MSETKQTVEEVHQTILETAASIANRALIEQNDPSRQSYLPGERFNVDARRERGGLTSGQIFRADPVQSTRGGLCLSLDELTTKGKTKQEVLELHAIGIAAIHEAITRWHPDLFAGLILGEAKEGRNYFDRFNDEHQQYRLF